MSKFTKMVAGIMLAGTVGLSGCFGGATVSKFDVTMPEGTFQVGDTFSLEGFTLNLTMSDGSTKSISLKDDMIVSTPDMTTGGEKTIKFNYDGKEYEFTITVEGYSKEQLLAKLKEFKEIYDAAQKSGDASAFMSYDLVAKYLSDKAEVGEESPKITITEDDTKVDQLMHHLYQSIIRSLVNSGAETTESEILNSNDLVVQMNLLRTFEKFTNSVKEFSYVNYLFNNVIFPESENVDYAQQITDALYEGLAFDAVGKRVLEDFVRTNVNDLTNNKEIDVVEELGEFNTIVQTHSSSTEVKEIFNIAYNEVKDLNKNTLSTFITKLAEMEWDLLYFYTKDTTNPNFIRYIPVEPSAETHYVNDTYLINFASMIKQVEDLIDGHVMNANYDASVHFTEIATACDNILALRTRIENNGWVEEDGFFAVCEEIKSIAESYQGHYLKFVGSVLEKYEMLDSVIYNIWWGVVEPQFFYGELEPVGVSSTGESLSEVQKIRDNIRKQAKVISTIIYDILKQEPNIDYWCEMLEITDADKIQEFKDEFATTGTVSILSYYLTDIIATLQEEDKEMLEPIINKCVDVVEYIEQLPIMLKEDAIEKFSWEKLQDLAKDAAETVLNNLTFNRYDYATGELGDEEILVKDAVCEDSCWPGKKLLELVKYVCNKDQVFLDNIRDFATDTATEMLNNIEVWVNEENPNVLLKDLKTVDPEGLYPQQLILEYLQAICDDSQTFAENTQNFVEANKYDMVDMATIVMGELLGIYEDTQPGGYGALKNAMTGIINDYIRDEFDAVESLESLLGVIDAYCDKDTKVVANSIALTTVVFLGKDSDTDFNEVFRDVELPAEIASIDFNKLIDKIWSEETYTKALRLSDVEIQYITDENGKVVKQVMSIALRVDFDVMISSIKGELKLNFEIVF